MRAGMRTAVEVALAFAVAAAGVVLVLGPLVWAFR